MILLWRKVGECFSIDANILSLKQSKALESQPPMEIIPGSNILITWLKAIPRLLPNSLYILQALGSF